MCAGNMKENGNVKWKHKTLGMNSERQKKRHKSKTIDETEYV